MKLSITPIYGNGWTDGDTTVDEPKPFTIEASQFSREAVIGKVITEQHALYGNTFQGKRRYCDDNLVFNCNIFPESVENVDTGQPILKGYCIIELKLRADD